MATHRIVYIGNFRPAHSTENHVAETLRRMGHDVLTMQENDPATFGPWIKDMDGLPLLVLWTRTGWDPPVPHDLQLRLLANCKASGVPVVGFHLDRWFGLGRAGQVDAEPFFRCDLVCTADGGHDNEWAARGIEHLWLQPAVAEFEIGWGQRDAGMVSDVAFVGSWDSYHPEWAWRRRLVRLVAARYGNRRFRCWPAPGQDAVRGQALRNLYASATVIVGDSCLAPTTSGLRQTRYWSDRIPETLGRGGLLIHPYVEGLEDQYELGTDLLTVEPENIEAMYEAIDTALAMPLGDQYEIRRNGMLAVMARHTYRNRMEQLLDEVHDRGLVQR